MSIIDNHINEIERLCKSNEVEALYVFGSVLTDKFNKDSDIDLLVDFKPMDISKYAEIYYNLKFGLQNLLNRPIDLLEQKAIKNPFFLQQLNKEKKLVYGH